MDDQTNVTSGVAFENETVEVDGRRFENCTFDNCIINYNGGDLSFSGCSFPSAVWHLGGDLGRGLINLGSTFGVNNEELFLEIIRQVAFPKLAATIN